MPIVFSFFAEVLSREKRGEHLSWLCMFWMIGEIYASAMAWAIIPHYGEFTSSPVWKRAFAMDLEVRLSLHYSNVACCP